MIDRKAFKETILINIPFWLGYIAGKTDKFMGIIAFGMIATIVVIMIKDGEKND